MRNKKNAAGAFQAVKDGKKSEHEAIAQDEFKAAEAASEAYGSALQALFDEIEALKSQFSDFALRRLRGEEVSTANFARIVGEVRGLEEALLFARQVGSEVINRLQKAKEALPPTTASFEAELVRLEGKISFLERDIKEGLRVQSHPYFMRARYDLEALEARLQSLAMRKKELLALLKPSRMEKKREELAALDLEQ